jgi:hypothetical protein
MILLGDKGPIPAMQGLHSDDGGDGLEPFAVDRMRQYGKTAAVGISEVEPTALVFRFEDAIFFNEIGDSLCLVPVDPSGEPGNQELENHSPTSGGKSRHHGSVQYTLNLRDFNWVETTEFFNNTTEEARVFAGDEPCYGEERHRTSASIDALQTAIN